MPQQVAAALAVARTWRSDARVIEVRTQQSNNYALELMFISPSDSSLFRVVIADGQTTTRAMPPYPNADTQHLPLQFMDLPQAVAAAEAKGMPGNVNQAWLNTDDQGRTQWMIQPNTGMGPHQYMVDVQTGEVSDAGDESSDIEP